MKTKRAIVVAVKAKILFGPLAENQALTYDTRTRKIALTKVTSFPGDIFFLIVFGDLKKSIKKDQAITAWNWKAGKVLLKIQRVSSDNEFFQGCLKSYYVKSPIFVQKLWIFNFCKVQPILICRKKVTLKSVWSCEKSRFWPHKTFKKCLPFHRNKLDKKWTFGTVWEALRIFVILKCFVV